MIRYSSQWLITRLLSLIAVVMAGLPAQAETKVEVFAKTELAGGNLTITPKGRMIMSLHPFYGPKWRVVEVSRDGTIKPFPNADMNDGPRADDELFLDGVLGLQSDRNGIVWMLDAGARDGTTPKIVAWDTRSNSLHRVIKLPQPVTTKASFLNDLAIDHTNRALYIADTALGGAPALIVVDLKTGTARRVLKNHKSVVPEDIPFAVDGTPIKFGKDKINPRVGVDAIAISPDEDWLYFGALSGTSMYRVRTADLRDLSIDEQTLAARVKRFGSKPISDGSTVDSAGNIYITGIENGTIGVLSAQGKYRALVKDPVLLSWPDDFAFGPDGWLYIVVNQLHLSAPMSGGADQSKPPYTIVRIRPLAPGEAGR